MDEGAQLVHLLPVAKQVVFPRSGVKARLNELNFKSVVDDILTGKKIIGIATLKKKNAPDNFSLQLPVYRTVCLARVIEHKRSDNGTYNLWIDGLERARIVREIKFQHYKVAKVEVLHSFFDRHKRSLLSESTRELIRLCEQLADLIPEKKDLIKNIIFANIHPGVLSDSIAFHLVKGVYEKQSILEELDIIRRIKLVSVQIRFLIRRFSRQPYKDFL